jgi:predicted Zn-dependent peptidase
MPLAHTVHEIKLKNGARGVLIDVPNTTAVSYEFNFRAGDDYAKNRNIQQVAHLLEHLMCGATEQFASAEAFSHEFERNGAYTNALTNSTDIIYYGTSALMELGRILELWEQAITKPRFTAQALEAEKSNVREELAGQLSDPERALSQRIARAMGGTSLLTAEELDTIDAVTLDDITEHYGRTHTLANMRFMIAGALTGHISAITEMLEGWQLPAGTEHLPIPKAVVHKGDGVAIPRSDLSSLFFNLTFAIGRQLSNRERDTMSILNYILSGTFHSRIYGKARTRGLCYGMGFDVSWYHDNTAEWLVTGQVSGRNADALYELIVDELRAVVARGVTEQELAEAKSSALGRLQLRGQTPDAIGEEYMPYVFNDEPIEFLWDTPQYIASINHADILRLAREFITSGYWTYGEIGPTNKSKLRAHEQIIARLFVAPQYDSAPHHQELTEPTVAA